jgi:hypothetical protein
MPFSKMQSARGLVEDIPPVIFLGSASKNELTAKASDYRA